MTKEEILQKLKDIKPKFEKQGISSIAVFGSYARDEATQSSDIDVAIKFEDGFLNNNDVWAYFNTINSLKDNISKALSMKCDILDLDSSSHILNRVKSEMIYV